MCDPVVEMAPAEIEVSPLLTKENLLWCWRGGVDVEEKEVLQKKSLFFYTIQGYLSFRPIGTNRAASPTVFTVLVAT